MECPKCLHDADTNSFSTNTIRENEKVDDNTWDIILVNEWRKRSCPSCGHNFPVGTNRIIRKHYLFKNPKQLPNALAQKASLLSRKKVSLHDVQNLFEIAVPEDAEKLLMNMVECGLMEMIEYPGTPKSTKRTVYKFTEQAPVIIRVSMGTLSPEEIMNKKIEKIKTLINQTISWPKNENEQLERIQVAINNQSEIVFSEDNSSIKLYDKKGVVIASLVVHGNKYDRIIHILIELGNLIIEKKICTTVDLARKIGIETNHISDNRRDIEKMIEYNIRYCGVIKSNIIKKNIGRLQIPDEYRDDIPEFEHHLREFLVNCFINESGENKAYESHILPIDPNKTKKNKPRKTFVNRLEKVLERDIDRASKKNDKNKKDEYKNNLKELNLNGKPISKKLLLRTLDQLDYKDYPYLVKLNWPILNFETKISYDEFVNHLNKIRINRIDWAHVKEAESDMLSLNESLFLLRTAIGKMPTH